MGHRDGLARDKPPQLLTTALLRRIEQAQATATPALCAAAEFWPYGRAADSVKK